jgi:hypothetical protein
MPRNRTAQIVKQYASNCTSAESAVFCLARTSTMVADLISVLLGWLPYTASRSTGARDEDDTSHPSLSELLKHPGLEKLAANASVRPVLGAARMLSKDSLIPPDHLVSPLL